MTVHVTLVDYGMGNLLSVQNAFLHLGASVQLARAGNELREATCVVVPGVGAFEAGMSGLRDRGLLPELQAHRERGTPILGICLGMQLLSDLGTEGGGETAGLGWIAGRCEPMAASAVRREAKLRVPHVGWNDVVGVGPLFEGLSPSASFYFVHSYHLEARDPDDVIGTTSYGETFVSAVQRSSVFGVQFHPEKSHKAGLALLANFLRYSAAARC